MTERTETDFAIAEQLANKKSDTPTRSNTTKVIIIIFAMILVIVGITGCYFAFLHYKNTNVEGAKHSVGGGKSRPKSDPISEPITLDQLLTSLTTLDNNIVKFIGDENTTKLQKSIIIINTNLSSVNSLNKSINEYSYLLSIKNPSDSLKLIKGVSACIYSSLKREGIKKIADKLKLIFPVEKENIDKTITELIKSIKFRGKNELSKIFSEMVNVDVDNNRLRDYLFNYYLYVKENIKQLEEQELINKIKELGILTNLSNNPTYEDVQREFYAYFLTLSVPVKIESVNEQNINFIFDLFGKKRKSIRNYVPLIKYYAAEDITNIKNN